MKRQIGHRSRSFAPALRGLLTVLLTVAYVVVGFAGEISCASETLAKPDQIEIGDASARTDQGKTDQGSKKPAGCRRSLLHLRSPADSAVDPGGRTDRQARSVDVRDPRVSA